jgi:hypothetical protein
VCRKNNEIGWGNSHFGFFFSAFCSFLAGVLKGPGFLGKALTFDAVKLGRRSTRAAIWQFPIWRQLGNNDHLKLSKASAVPSLRPGWQCRG